MLRPSIGSIDWTHPASLGLVAAALPLDGHGRGVFEAVSGERRVGASGTAVWSAGRSGSSLGNGGSLLLPRFDVRAGATECSLTVLARLEAGFANWSQWCALCDSAGNPILRVLNNDGAPTPTVYAEASDSAGTMWSGGMAELTLGSAVVVTATLASDRKCRLYAAGRLVAESSTGLGGVARSLATLVAGGSCAQTAGSAHWEVCLAHDRALSADDVFGLHLDPYAPLR